MSRRESRVHISVRQNDTLQEFQNFKKSFLVANKQITKQNSGLHAKIEELNAHISTLYVENLRLRASEIALSTQLRREKEKCHRIMTDAEAATMNLLKHLGIIRQSYSVAPPESSSGKSSPDPKDPDVPPQPPSARPRPRSPTAPRLAQQPSVPDIVEDVEPHESFEHKHHKHDVHSSELPSSRVKSVHPNSRLPVPSRVASPPPAGMGHWKLKIGDEDLQKKRKLTRRPSGLMGTPTDLPERPPSPTFNATHDAGLDLTDDEIVEVEVLSQRHIHDENEPLVVPSDASSSDSHAAVKENIKRERKSKSESERGDVTERKSRKKVKDRSNTLDVKLQDVTNSPRAGEGPSAMEIANAISEVVTSSQQFERDSPPASDLPRSSSPSTFSDPGYLPTPISSSNATTPVAMLSSAFGDIDGISGGRERRARKSVNYTEPSLRKKMRKPDSFPPPGSRPSLSVTIPTPESTPPPEIQPRLSLDSSDAEAVSNPSVSSKSRSDGATRASSVVTKRKRTTRRNSDEGSETGDCDEDDDGAEADGESSDMRRLHVNGSTRRRSAQDQDNTRTTMGIDKRRLKETDDLRRHSIAV